MPEHFDMASLRQFARSALWTSLEICAVAGTDRVSKASVAKTRSIRRLYRVFMVFPPAMIGL
jgi:hypothetical protein